MVVAGLGGDGGDFGKLSRAEGAFIGDGGAAGAGVGAGGGWQSVEGVAGDTHDDVVTCEGGAFGLADEWGALDVGGCAQGGAASGRPLAPRPLAHSQRRV